MIPQDKSVVEQRTPVELTSAEHLSPSYHLSLHSGILLHRYSTIQNPTLTDVSLSLHVSAPQPCKAFQGLTSNLDSSDPWRNVGGMKPSLSKRYRLLFTLWAKDNFVRITVPEPTIFLANDDPIGDFHTYFPAGIWNKRDTVDFVGQAIKVMHMLIYKRDQGSNIVFYLFISWFLFHLCKRRTPFPTRCPLSTGSLPTRRLPARRLPATATSWVFSG